MPRKLTPPHANLVQKGSSEVYVTCLVRILSIAECTSTKINAPNLRKVVQKAAAANDVHCIIFLNCWERRISTCTSLQLSNADTSQSFVIHTVLLHNVERCLIFFFLRSLFLLKSFRFRRSNHAVSVIIFDSHSAC